eukprot:EG_transcript_13703
MPSAVDLSNCQLQDDDVRQLCRKLRDDNSVRSLDLSGNHLGWEAAKAVADLLSTNRSITRVDLNVNNIGDEGALFLSKALRHNTTLNELLLYGNGISVIGDNHLLYALQHNTTLCYVDLEYEAGYSGAAVQQRISDCVRYNRAASKAAIPFDGALGTPVLQALCDPDANWNRTPKPHRSPLRDIPLNSANPLRQSGSLREKLSFCSTPPTPKTVPSTGRLSNPPGQVKELRSMLASSDSMRSLRAFNLRPAEVATPNPEESASWGDYLQDVMAHVACTLNPQLAPAYFA